MRSRTENDYHVLRFHEDLMTKLTQIGCNFSIWRGLFKDPGPSVSAPIIRCGGLAHALRRNIKVTPLNLNKVSLSYVDDFVFSSRFSRTTYQPHQKKRGALKREMGLRGGVYINRVHYMVIYNSFSKSELQKHHVYKQQRWGTHIARPKRLRAGKNPISTQFQIDVITFAAHRFSRV